MLSRMVAGVEGRIVDSRAESHAEVRRERVEARKRVPPVAWKLPLEELDLPGRIHNLLLDNDVDTVGAVLLNLEMGDEVYLGFHGFGDKMLETLKEYVAVYQMPVEDIVEEELVEAVDQETIEEIEEDIVEESVEEVESEELLAIVEESLAEAGAVEEELLVAMPDEEVVEDEEELVPDIDDLSKSLFEIEPEPVKKTKKKPAIVVVSSDDRPGEERESDDKSDPRRGRSLVFDEKAGEVVVKRKRKRGRGRPDWEEFDSDEL